MKVMSEGQRGYEAKRAAKAGMSLEKWLAEKARAEADEQRARERERSAQVKLEAKATKRGGLLARLIERGHKPLGKSSS